MKVTAYRGLDGMTAMLKEFIKTEVPFEHTWNHYPSDYRITRTGAAIPLTHKLTAEEYGFLDAILVCTRHLFPGVCPQDMLPISALKVSDLAAFQAITILRSVEATAEEKNQAARALVAIDIAPHGRVRLYDKAANKILSALLGDPVTCRQFLSDTLPWIVCQAILSDGSLRKYKTGSRAKDIQDHKGKTLRIPPKSYPLSIYRKWLRTDVFDKLVKWAIELGVEPAGCKPTDMMEPDTKNLKEHESKPTRYYESGQTKPTGRVADKKQDWGIEGHLTAEDRADYRAFFAGSVRDSMDYLERNQSESLGVEDHVEIARHPDDVETARARLDEYAKAWTGWLKSLPRVTRKMVKDMVRFLADDESRTGEDAIEESKRWVKNKNTAKSRILRLKKACRKYPFSGRDPGHLLETSDGSLRVPLHTIMYLKKIGILTEGSRMIPDRIYRLLAIATMPKPGPRPDASDARHPTMDEGFDLQPGGLDLSTMDEGFDPLPSEIRNTIGVDLSGPRRIDCGCGICRPISFTLSA